MNIRLTILVLLLSMGTLGFAQMKDTVAHHGNGAIKLRGQLKNGKPEGQWKWFYRTGRLKMVTNYQAGNKTGVELEYGPGKREKLLAEDTASYHSLVKRAFEENQLVYERQLFYNRTDTVRTREIVFEGKGKRISEWHPNGRLTSIAEYNEIGQEHGKHQRWTKDGNLLYNYTYVDGILQGSYQSFYTSGIPKDLGNDTIGVEIKYFPNGVVKEITFLKSLCGEQYCYEQYFESGRKKEELVNVGEMVRLTTWNVDGSADERLVGNGFEKIQGWFPTGILRYSGVYLNGDGEIRWWNKFGTLESVGYYKDSRRHGKWKFFNENGILIRTETYENGVLVAEAGDKLPED